MSGGSLAGVGIGIGIGATGGTEAIATATMTATGTGARGRDLGVIVPGLAQETGTARIGAGAEVHAVGAEAAIARPSSDEHWRTLGWGNSYHFIHLSLHHGEDICFKTCR